MQCNAMQCNYAIRAMPGQTLMHSSITTLSRCSEIGSVHHQLHYIENQLHTMHLDAINYCNVLSCICMALHCTLVEGLDGGWVGQVIGCTVITIMGPPAAQAHGQETMQTSCRKNSAHRSLCIIPLHCV